MFLTTTHFMPYKFISDKQVWDIMNHYQDVINDNYPNCGRQIWNKYPWVPHKSSYEAIIRYLDDNSNAGCAYLVSFVPVKIVYALITWYLILYVIRIFPSKHHLHSLFLIDKMYLKIILWLYAHYIGMW